MKKILFIIPSLSTGGTNSSLNSLYPRLRGRYKISVFSISHRSHSQSYSFEESLLNEDLLLSFIYTPFSDQRGWCKLFASFIKLLRSLVWVFGKELGLLWGKHVVRQLEDKYKYDTIIGFQEGDATKLTALFTNPNKIAWIHSNYNMYLPNTLSEETMYSSFKKIICVSEYTASVFTQRYPNLNERTLFIHNVIDADRIRQLAEEPITDDRFSKDGIRLISVGRFSKVKRFREIPAIASYLKSRGIKFTWYVIGANDHSDEETLFISNLDKYNAHDCVKWLGSKSNPYPFFKASSIYICLSESEACPMVFIEARLFGLPIVTTNFPSSYEFVREGEGVITSFASLSEAIKDMISRINDGYRIPPYNDDFGKDLKKVYELFD